MARPPVTMSEARAALERHAQSINARDVEAYRLATNFPFTYQNYDGIALTIASAVQCGATVPLPWEIILRADPDWHHTQFDLVEEVARSISSVVYKLDFRRVDTSGRSSRSSQAIWIVTCQREHWGVQFRHNLGRPAS